jgi:hypothetical protein
MYSWAGRLVFRGWAKGTPNRRKAKWRACFRGILEGSGARQTPVSFPQSRSIGQQMGCEAVATGALRICYNVPAFWRVGAIRDHRS